MPEKKSRVCADSKLRAPLKAEQEKRWLQENSAAIDAINNFIEKHGLLASRLRYRP
jgi:post-segregation antitoxin (ccd killing protein)